MSTLGNDELYNIIKKDLLCLKFKPGQMISENDIAKVYNVSRTPVRSVFSRLKNEKLINVLPQRGSFVALLDLEDIKNTIYIRTLIETDILSSIIGIINNAQFLELEKNLERQNNLIKCPEVDIFKYFEIDSKFHELLFEFDGKKSMWSIIQNFQVSYTRFRMLDMIITKNYEKLYDEHLIIYKFLKEKNIIELNKFIKKHLFGNIERLKNYIDKEYKEYFIEYN